MRAEYGLKKFIEVVEVDTLSQVDVRTGATTIGNPQIYKTSPNYRPTTNIKLKKDYFKNDNKCFIY